MTTIKETRRWHVIIDRDAAWPDLPRTTQPGLRLRVERLSFWVDVRPDGVLETPGVAAHGVNIRKDGSLGAQSERWLYPHPPAWIVPLVAEVLTQITLADWPTLGAPCWRCAKAPVGKPGATTADGKPLDRALFCDPCIGRCHEASEFDHICQVCASPDEARARGWAVTR